MQHQFDQLHPSVLHSSCCAPVLLAAGACQCCDRAHSRASGQICCSCLCPGNNCHSAVETTSYLSWVKQTLCCSVQRVCSVLTGPMVGARLVLPGPYLDGENIYALMDTYKVTVSTGRGLAAQGTRSLSAQVGVEPGHCVRHVWQCGLCHVVVSYIWLQQLSTQHPTTCRDVQFSGLLRQTFIKRHMNRAAKRECRCQLWMQAIVLPVFFSCLLMPLLALSIPPQGLIHVISLPHSFQSEHSRLSEGACAVLPVSVLVRLPLPCQACPQCGSTCCSM